MIWQGEDLLELKFLKRSNYSGRMHGNIDVAICMRQLVKCLCHVLVSVSRWSIPKGLWSILQKTSAFSEKSYFCKVLVLEGVSFRKQLFPNTLLTFAL